MKIYTRKGDEGVTSLFGGARVAKSEPRVAAYGDVDELNSVLGTVVAALPSELETWREPLTAVQSDCFTIGALLATPASGDAKPGHIPDLPASRVEELEAWIDRLDEELESLRSFVLPGGAPTAAALHLARTVCRRAERSVVALARVEEVEPVVLRYLNRLSDLLFTLARAANARLGEGPYLVAEADESDASFLFLTPMLAVITNIDADHLETYGGDFGRLKNTFVEFIHHLPFYGLAVLCVDDPVVRGILPRVGRPVLTYGVETDADLWAEKLEPVDAGTRFVLRTKDSEQGWTVHLAMPGRHNVLNALAAAAVARELGVQMGAIREALSSFAGIGRRCEVLGELDLDGKRCLLVDDYGHHPREIENIVAAVRGAWPDRRPLVVFQPHRYSRTRDLFEDFCQVLAELDALVLCEVYPAGEDAVANADGRTLARGVRARGGVNPVFLSDLRELPELLDDVARDGDVVLTLGAGDIGQAAADLARDKGVKAV